MTLVGGLGTVFGPIVGAAVIVGMQNYLATLGAWVLVVQGVIFVVCVLLFREGRSHHVASGEEFAAKARDVTGIRAVGASFLVLFAAEWGDLSQLLTLTLVARYEDPLSVFVGALGALLAVSGLAVLVGRALLRVVPLHTLHYVGAAVCLVLAALVGYELVS